MPGGRSQELVWAEFEPGGPPGWRLSQVPPGLLNPPRSGQWPGPCSGLGCLGSSGWPSRPRGALNGVGAGASSSSPAAVLLDEGGQMVPPQVDWGSALCGQQPSRALQEATAGPEWGTPGRRRWHRCSPAALHCTSGWPLSAVCPPLRPLLGWSWFPACPREALCPGRGLTGLSCFEGGKLVRALRYRPVSKLHTNKREGRMRE